MSVNNFIAESVRIFIPKNVNRIGFLGSFDVLNILSPLNSYIHELGHAVALKLLSKNAQPEITLFDWGYNGAHCNPGIQKDTIDFCDERGVLSQASVENALLSPVGKMIGLTGSRGAIAAAGPLVEVLYHVSVVAGTDSGIAALLILPNSLKVSHYALSALWMEKMSIEHDFHSIRQAGGTWIYIGMTFVCIASTLFVAYKALDHIMNWVLPPERDLEKNS